MICLFPARVKKSKARQTAYSILNCFGISTPEVPVKKILKEYGRLFLFEGNCLDTKNDAGFCIYNGAEYSIYINKELSGGVDNFAYAHELGHIVLGHFKDYDVNNLSDNQLWLLNREADIFATNLLMPEHMLQTYITTPLSVQDIGYYKTWFGVSWEAFINRLDELNICPKCIVNNLFEEWRISKTVK